MMKKKSGMLQEFKEFAIRGNVVDMIIGITVGAAFGTIIKSLVSDIIIPPIGFFLKKIDLSQMYINLSGGEFTSLQEAKKAGAVTINYGEFINNLISFIILAVIVFLFVKYVNRLRRKEDTTSITPTQKSCPFCFHSISIKATRCPQCTSRLKEKGIRKTKQKRGQIKKGPGRSNSQGTGKKI